MLRLLASEPADFAAQHGVRLHEVAQSVAQHSLAFMKTFPLETSPDWFGHLVIEGESQQLVGICSLKGPPVEGTVEMAYFTFPGFEGRGIGTAMARFVLDRATVLQDVRRVTAHTAPAHNASTTNPGKDRHAVRVRGNGGRCCGVALADCGGRLALRAAPFADGADLFLGDVQEFQEFLVLVGSVVFELGVQSAHILFAEAGSA